MTPALGTYHYNLGQAFAQVARMHGANPALLLAEHRYSYQDLDAAVQDLAAMLLRHGLRRGQVIAIGNEKAFLSFALMLAALRIGIAYVNIDVKSPEERNALILETADPQILFYDDNAHQDAMTALAAQQGCELVALSKAENIPRASPEELQHQEQLCAAVDGATIAYIMFTSGSTGTPKGVAVTHQNVLHLISWGQQRFSAEPGTIFANLSPMYFDNSVFDFYVGLFSGAALAPVPRALLTQPYELVAFVQEKEATLWFSVPSLLIYLTTMKAFAPGSLSSLRHIVFGGEGYPKGELKKLFDRFGAQAELVNVYGPTECTCICSAYRIGEADFADMTGFATLGRLNPNFDYMIVDENDTETDVGELLLIGPNVAAGYYRDPERTARAFGAIDTPERFMKRMYRTGDILRDTEDGLFFVGRRDNQIKHMGYRIELEEIEHALSRQIFVNQAAVLYQRSHAAFGKIIAFVSASGGTEESQLLAALRDRLPEYMMPARIHIMESLPKNANGKVDKQRLLEHLNG